MKSLKFFEPGTKGILFGDGSWHIWKTGPSGSPLHHAIAMEFPKKTPKLSAFFSTDKRWIDIALDADADVCETRILSAIDKVIGFTGSTYIRIETRDSKFEGDMVKYARRCGMQIDTNPPKRRRK